jgi:hypothetical protein
VVASPGAQQRIVSMAKNATRTPELLRIPADRVAELRTQGEP